MHQSIFRLITSIALITFLIIIGQLLLNDHANAAGSATLQLLGPGNAVQPVVNEGNQIKLILFDSNNQPVTNGVTFASGSPDIAAVDPQSGMVTGKLFGFATITARTANNSASAF